MDRFLSDKWRLKAHNSDVSFPDVGSYPMESVVVGMVAMLDVILFMTFKRNVASKYDADWLCRETQSRPDWELESHSKTRYNNDDKNNNINITLRSYEPWGTRKAGEWTVQYKVYVTDTFQESPIFWRGWGWGWGWGVRTIIVLKVNKSEYFALAKV